MTELKNLDLHGERVVYVDEGSGEVLLLLQWEVRKNIIKKS